MKVCAFFTLNFQNRFQGIYGPTKVMNESFLGFYFSFL